MPDEVTHRCHADLSSFLALLDVNQEWRWAYQNFNLIVTGLIHEFGSRDICELGGGRRPFLSLEQIADLEINYVVNDIAASELSRAPDEVGKACFDLTANTLPEEFHECFDFVFSRMLMEHVSDGRKAYANIFRMLRHDGIFLNFHPVLYSPALVLNWIVSERLTKPLLQRLQPHRHEHGNPKFPVHYSYCVVSNKTKRMLYEIGFREVFLLPFYGHNYLKRIPVLQSVQDVLSDYAQRHRLSRFATLCFTIGRK